MYFSPQLCVGFLFLILYPGSLPRLLPASSRLLSLSTSRLPPSIFHTQLCHTPSFTHSFVTHHLSHTTLSHTIFHIFHIQLCHTPSFTYNFVKHYLSHTTLSNTIFHIFHIQLCHTPSFTHHIYRRFKWQAWHKLTSAALCVAGVAQTHIYHRFAWQAWH